jgi:hypothetical protein
MAMTTTLTYAEVKQMTSDLNNLYLDNDLDFQLDRSGDQVRMLTAGVMTNITHTSLEKLWLAAHGRTTQ